MSATPEPSEAAEKVLRSRLSAGIEALARSGRASMVAGGSGPAREAASDRYEPFPLSDMQEAYWIGRQNVLELGGTSIHSYRETELENLDLARLNESWMALVRRHDMLRAVVTRNGMQQVRAETPEYRIELTDLSAADPDTVERHLEAAREAMSHAVYAFDCWPLWQIRATRLNERITRLHISFDGILIDDRSYQVLIREWFRLYRDPGAALRPLGFSFREYILQERAGRDSEDYSRSLRYWQQRVQSLPASPDLPMTLDPATIRSARFRRHQSRIEPPEWDRLRQLCVAARLTAPGLLLACFIEVLKEWSKSAELTVNVPSLNRQPLHPDVNDIVGEFGSFVLIGNDGCAAGSFISRVREIQQRLWEGLEHERVSGVRITRELIRHSKAPATARMPVVFTMASKLPDEDRVAAGMHLPVSFGITQTPQVYLDHQAAELHGGLNYNWDIVDGLFPEGMIDSMFEAYGSLLQRLAADARLLEEDAPVGLPARERHERERVNDTVTEWPARLLHEMNGSPEAVPDLQPAAIAAHGSLSYSELHTRANGLARALYDQGVSAGEPVAVLAAKGLDQIIAVLGILKAGAAYLPVSADAPPVYREKLLKSAGVRVVVAQRVLLGPETMADGRIGIALEDVSPAVSPPPPFGRDLDRLAYIIYTSGSTGEPKGVMITHRAAVNTIFDINRRFRVAATDRIFGVSALGFDLSVYDIFGALAEGATLVLPDASRLREPAHLLATMERHGVTIWNSVPALMEMLVQYLADMKLRLPDSLRLVLLSGDWIPVDLPDRIRSLGRAVQVVSLGGATEAAIWSILHPTDQLQPAARSIPYGRPLANQRFHVLNAAGRDCPIWVPGKLYIEGIGLAQGYWRDAHRTAERFVMHPGKHLRLYDTGDWGRYLPGGDIEFLGREDRQVKVNGFRIELGEIEAALQAHPAIERAIAVKSGSGRLRAFFQTRGEAVSATDLKTWLSGRLPPQMVPGLLSRIEQWPLTANGKLDLQALGRLEEGPAAAAGQSAGAGTRERELLLASVRSVLKLEAPDTRSSLFELGASSIDLVRIANLLHRDLGTRLKLEQLFSAPSLDHLIALLAPESVLSATSGEVPLRHRSGIGMLHGTALGPDAHQAIKGGRSDVDSLPALQLIRAHRNASADGVRSTRQFSLSPVTFPALSRLLEACACDETGGTRRYRYASAGSTYAVQLYVYAKPGRVRGLLPGIYYYHAGRHQLVETARGHCLDRTVFGELNRPIFDSGAFCLFLVYPPGVMERSYGEWGYDLAMYEAGSIGQLLRTEAAALGLGLCGIGTLDFARIRPVFGLGEGHLLLHSFVAGRRLAADPPMSGGALAPAARVAAMIERLRELSDHEAASLNGALDMTYESHA